MRRANSMKTKRVAAMNNRINFPLKITHEHQNRLAGEPIRKAQYIGSLGLSILCFEARRLYIFPIWILHCSIIYHSHTYRRNMSTFVKLMLQLL